MRTCRRSPICTRLALMCSPTCDPPRAAIERRYFLPLSWFLFDRFFNFQGFNESDSETSSGLFTIREEETREAVTLVFRLASSILIFCFAFCLLQFDPQRLRVREGPQARIRAARHDYPVQKNQLQTGIPHLTVHSGKISLHNTMFSSPTRSRSCSRKRPRPPNWASTIPRPCARPEPRAFSPYLVVQSMRHFHPITRLCLLFTLTLSNPYLPHSRRNAHSPPTLSRL